MAEDRNFELKVGLFVAIGLIIFFIIIFSIGDVRLVKNGYRLCATFNFVNGLAESAPVRLAGVNIGHVEKIYIQRDESEKRTKVNVSLWINSENIKIENNARATINTLGLLGEKYLEIFPGTFETGFVKSGDRLIGQDPVVMETLTNTMNKLAESANIVMTNLAEGKGTVGKLLTEEKIYNDLEAFVADIKAHPWKLFIKSN